MIEQESVEVLLVPLPGHSQGHCGVAVGKGGNWLFHCGDAYVREMQIDPDHPRSAFPRWAAFIERTLFPKKSIEVLRTLIKKHDSQIRLLASHDSIAFAKYSKAD